MFVGLPLIDTLLVVILGRYIGFWQTVALVIVSGLLGAWLAKSQGLRVWRGIQRELAGLL